MDIVRRNFFRLLRAGVLDEAGEMEPMSPFKWRQVIQLLRAQSVLPLGAKGLSIYQGDKRMNMPEELVAQVMTEGKNCENNPFRAEAKLSNPFLNNRLNNICQTEPHAIDCNIETLRLLDIIVANINHVMSRGLSLQGVLEIGLYLREKGDRVDFVKLDSWLGRLHIARMASLLGSILVEVFEFDEDEIPFIRRRDPKVDKLLMRALQNGDDHQETSLLFRFQPLETTTRFVRNIKQQLAEIEE